MSTQHSDCAFLPKWMKEKIFHNDLEVEEVFRSFKLGCDEQLLDWEGKDVDSHVVKKLLAKHGDFFKDNVIGEDVFITYRLPNPDVEIQEKKFLKRWNLYLEVLILLHLFIRKTHLQFKLPCL